LRSIRTVTRSTNASRQAAILHRASLSRAFASFGPLDGNVSFLVCAARLSVCERRDESTDGFVDAAAGLRPLEAAHVTAGDLISSSDQSLRAISPVELAVTVLGDAAGK